MQYKTTAMNLQKGLLEVTLSLQSLKSVSTSAKCVNNCNILARKR